MSVQRAYDLATERFIRREFPRLLVEVRKNLTGRIMNRRTGRTLTNVIRRSRRLRKGFKIATTSPALIAWMRGSARKAFFVRPRRAKALRWVDAGGVHFSRGHMIGPWRFRPRRPVLEDAQKRREGSMLKTAGQVAIGALTEVFKDQRRVVRIRI